MSNLLKYLGLISLIGGIIAGVVAGNEVKELTTTLFGSQYSDDFNIKIAMIWWISGLVSCIVFYTLSMILEKLDYLQFQMNSLSQSKLNNEQKTQ